MGNVSLCEKRRGYYTLVSQQAKRRIILVKLWEKQMNSLRNVCTDIEEVLNKTNSLNAKKMIHHKEIREKSLQTQKSVCVSSGIHQNAVQLNRQIVRMEN